MAPGLPDVALTYHITSPTVVALTLSAFLISFALGVRSIHLIIQLFPKVSFTAARHGAIIRDVWPYLGEQALNFVAIVL